MLAMGWFRKSSLDPLAVTMAGIKLGDRLIVIGAADTALTAALAAKTGLTGRTCMVDESGDTIGAAAEAVLRDGGLVEPFTAPWTMLPFDPDAFDVAVIRHPLSALDPEARLRSVREVHRVLRGGGRLLVIEDQGSTGVSRLFRSGGAAGGQYERGGGAAHVVEAAGFRAVRTLAEREGQRFVEGIKAAVPQS
jgi:SAM-dependent methyltransferase